MERDGSGTDGEAESRGGTRVFSECPRLRVLPPVESPHPPPPKKIRFPISLGNIGLGERHRRRFLKKLEGDFRKRAQENRRLFTVFEREEMVLERQGDLNEIWGLM